MTIYHCDIKVLNRKRWPSILKPAAYRAGERLRDLHSGKVHNYQPRPGVLYTQIMAPEHAPTWASVRADLWNAVELIEKRKDAQLAREILVALPSELNLEDWIELLQRFISEHFTSKGLIADFAIHAPSETGDNRNFHAHILTTMRSISSEGFGLKVRELNLKHNIFTWRQSWAHLMNQTLERAGFECRVDCRSHAGRGLDREPKAHLGYEVMLKERQGNPTELGNKNREIEARNALETEFRSDLGITDETHRVSIPDVGQNSRINPDDNQRSASINTDSNQMTEAGILPDHLLTPRALINLLKQRVDSAGESADVLKDLMDEFGQRVSIIQSLLSSASEEPIKNRLQLQIKLESAFFTQIYNKTRARILEREDSQKNVNEISACQHRARKAGIELDNHTSQWNYRSVTDMSYIPTDQQVENKITALQDLVKSRYSELSIRAENAGWSPERYNREVQALQQALDQEIEFSLGLDLGLTHQMSMER